MNYQQLIFQSKEWLQENPGYVTPAFSVNIFSSGANWMADRLNEMDQHKTTIPDPAVNFNFYGMFKYGICLASFFVSAFLFSRVSIFLMPLSIAVFYFFEIHFLFLFPLLIDGTKYPVFESIRQTYKIGIVRSLITVIPISLFMIIGLTNFRAPFKNWYTGSLAILIWYKHEIRNRI